MRDLGRSETRRVVLRGRELDLGSVLRGGTEVGGVLGIGRWDMVETLQGFGYIVGHADVNGAVGVVPI